MYLQHLLLGKFRNHTKITVDFTAQTTAIIGPNAAGKTNILEAIGLLSTGKSIKAQREEEFIQFGEESCYIEGLLCHPELSKTVKPGSRIEVGDDAQGSDTKLSIAIARNAYGRVSRQYTVNGVKRRRMDFVGNLASVLFAPQDIDLIVDSPGLRRDYINTVLSQVDKDYRHRLSRYENTVKRRNKVLWFIREGKARGTDLDIWDHILVETGKWIIYARIMFFEELNRLNESFEYIHWNYLPHEISQEKLDINRARDIDAAQTLSGPHRDDFEFFDDKRNLAHFGSRGEQRIAVLALKLAELSYVAEKIDDRPVLLLDDIFSELDEQHRKVVMDLLGKQQTILTSVQEEYIEEAKRSDVQMVRVICHCEKSMTKQSR